MTMDRRLAGGGIQALILVAALAVGFESSPAAKPDLDPGCTAPGTHLVSRLETPDTYQFRWLAPPIGERQNKDAPRALHIVPVDRRWIADATDSSRHEFGLDDAAGRAALRGYHAVSAGGSPVGAGPTVLRNASLAVTITDAESLLLVPDYEEVLARNTRRMGRMLKGLKDPKLASVESSRRDPGPLYRTHWLVEDFVRHCRYGASGCSDGREPEGFLPPIEFLMQDDIVGDCDTKTLLYSCLVSELALETSLADSFIVSFVEFWSGPSAPETFHFCVAFGEPIASLVDATARESVDYRGCAVVDVSRCDEDPDQYKRRRFAFQRQWKRCLAMLEDGKTVMLHNETGDSIGGVPAFRDYPMMVSVTGDGRLRLRSLSWQRGLAPAAVGR
jgi:hypothetical protein